MKKRFHKLNLDIEKRIIYDQPHRKSFFQKEYVQMKWNKSKLSRSLLEFNIVQIVTLINSKQEAKQRTILIHENIIAKVCKDGAHACIDYENSIYEPITHLQYGEGMKLTKCFDSIEIYGDMEKILQIVKRFTIQLDYSQYFVNVKRLSHCDKAEVFRIKSKLDRNDYQCRIINKKNLTTNIELQIEKEHYILRRMQEECIQKYFGTFETQDQILIIEELLIGGNLDGYLHRWSLFSEEKACKIFFKLFKTLAYLHSKGIMHRDLKPENIGLRLNGNLESPCITSFGLADIIEKEEEEEEYSYQEHQHLYQRCGTPGYVAPEILQNRKYDCKVDVYSMGIIIFQTLTGKKPFENEDYQQMLEANEEGVVDIQSLKLSKEGMIFVESILQPDPEERITAQIALNHQWFRNEKLTQLSDVKAHNRLRKIKLKRTNYRISVQHQPNFLPTVVKSEIFSNTQSPIFQPSSTQRGSVNNSSTFRISTLNSSFSPKDFNDRKAGFYSTFNHKMKLSELSPLYSQQEYHNGIYFNRFRK